MSGENHRRLSGGRWNQVRRLVLERDGGICQQCGGDESPEVDHIIPLSHMTEDQWAEGLPWNPDNLRVLCKVHNGQRQNRVQARQAWFDPQYLDHI